MLNLKKLSLVGAMVAAMTLSAHALNITPATLPQWTGDDNSNMDASAISAFLATQGVNVSLTEVFKQNGSGDSGNLTITQNLVVSGSIFLYVKDGNHEPAFYIFDITGWNGTEDIFLSGFWPNGGAISHAAILTGPGTSVPDAGGTLALLGLAIGSLGLVRFKRSV